ncbi:MAG: hypothetical protein Fur003_1360 [Candidatus Dojkabacteria bacterium]
MMKNLITKTIQFILAGLLLLATPLTAFAYTLVEKSSLDQDKSLITESSQTYAFPSQILVTQITSPNELITKDSNKWVNLLYYYYITRLGFADIPYNFIVDRDGNVYEGHSGWSGVNPEMAEGSGAILIGYLSNGSDVTLSAQSTFKQLIEELSYKYGIPRASLKLVDLKLAPKSSETSLSKLATANSTNAFSKNLVVYANKYKYYSQYHLSYQASVTPKEISLEAKAGEKATVTVNVKNEGEMPWFPAKTLIILQTSNGKESKYAINGVWDSFASPLSLDSAPLLPGEDRRLTFDMQAPLIGGKYSESFKFRIINAADLSNSEFKVNFNVAKGDFKLVKIKDTGAGYLNVHKDPFVNSPNIAQVPVGQTYVVESTQPGWYKIKYADGKSGWVIGKYIEEL